MWGNSLKVPFHENEKDFALEFRYYQEKHQDVKTSLNLAIFPVPLFVGSGGPSVAKTNREPALIARYGGNLLHLRPAPIPDSQIVVESSLDPDYSKSPSLFRREGNEKYHNSMKRLKF